ncbi:unnamed protein product, partial [Ilex paraguariensis]
MEVLSNVSPCSILLEAQLKAIKEKSKDPEAAEPEPEPTTEVLFLCSYQGCGKTFIDAGALRKHSHIHGEKQYVCNYDNCVKGLHVTGPIYTMLCNYFAWTTIHLLPKKWLIRPS